MEEHHTQGEDQLRLFPLNVVMFPGMSMPLRIFEERYKIMISECLDTDAPFGVTLIQEGREVGGPAKPHETGTTARITGVERLEDGRMNLSTTGERRFRILDTTNDRPYLMGKVEYPPEDLGEIDEGVLKKARELFGQYLQGLAGLRGGWMREAEVPEDPLHLSYSIAHYLEVPTKARQRLLEVPFIGERLQYEIPLLEGAIGRLNEEIEKRSPYKGPRLN